MAFLHVGGTPLHVRTEGSGPVVLLAGGLGSSWFDWDLVVPFLTPTARWSASTGPATG
ncbi:alpha/beta fold hydrolase [Kitasatospora aburaviensis]